MGEMRSRVKIVLMKGVMQRVVAVEIVAAAARVEMLLAS